MDELQPILTGDRANNRETAELRNLPVSKNEDYIADIVGIGHEGEGVGRVNGYTLFIPGALPGERVRTKVLKVKKQYGYGKLLEVLEKSPDRIKAPCPIYNQCGGCQLQHLGYDAQLRHKQQLVVDALERIGKLTVRKSTEQRGKGAHVEESDENVKADESIDSGSKGILVHPVIGMPNPWQYRNKAQVPIGEVEGGLVGGFYAQGSHRIIDMDACLIQHEANDVAVRTVKVIARKLGISAYNEETKQGLLRHVVVKIGTRTGDMMVILVLNGKRLAAQSDLISEIREALPGVKSICLNFNTEQTNVIFGDRTDVIWGNDVIYDFIGDIKFAISARSFYQVNSVQTEVLYNTALEYAGLTGSETVIDAYCGIGTISLFLARHAGHVHGVEMVAEAIADARRNAELNDLHNVSFAVGKAEEVIPAWQAEGVAPDVIVVDPPRKGCEPELLETMLAMRPARIVYVSCNPATLARDLRVLEDGGYRAIEVQPVDMFPHTTHVETVCLLER
ncbi:MAG: 23S rRNA (uracil(1939)-C(5))-methyltransferase RlmD [Gorillibacterium sp.]|nr:23S rRNA (uracil(1939)-C(5))-methyltransferase RlmD [Gorillibacterium sp.]